MALSKQAHCDLIRYVYGTVAAYALSAANSYLASIIQLAPGKTVNSIGVYCSGSSSGVVDVQLETVSGGLPTGTLVATGASLTSQSVSASTWYTFNLSTPYTVPTGASTLAAAVIRYVSGTSATFNRMGAASMGWGGVQYVPRMVEYNGSTATTRNVAPSMIIGYSDGSYSSLCWALNTANASNSVSINTGATYDEYGNSFTPTANMNCVGISLISRSINSPTAVLRIYDADTSTQLTTDSELTLTTEQITSGNAYNCYVPLQTPIKLIAGKRYYCTVKVTTASANSLYAYDSTFTSQAVADACSALENTKHVVRKGTGAWTETASKIYCISPVCSYAYMPLRGCNTGGFCG